MHECKLTSTGKTDRFSKACEVKSIKGQFCRLTIGFTLSDIKKATIISKYQWLQNFQANVNFESYH